MCILCLFGGVQIEFQKRRLTGIRCYHENVLTVLCKMRFRSEKKTNSVQPKQVKKDQSVFVMFYRDFT